MRIYRFTEDPSSSGFAQMGFRGTWGGAPPCGTCELRRVRAVEPLVVEWERGTPREGDFSWPSEVVVSTREVADELAARFSTFRIADIELTWPRRSGLRTTPALPYTGPPLCSWWFDGLVEADAAASSIGRPHRCRECGETWGAVKGYEEFRVVGDLSGASRWVREPRTPGRGLMVRRSALGGRAIFKVCHDTRYVFCLESVKRYVDQRGFTNVTFLEVGDVIDD